MDMHEEPDDSERLAQEEAQPFAQIIGSNHNRERSLPKSEM